MAKPFESRIEPWDEFNLIRVAPAVASSVLVAEMDPSTGKMKTTEKGKAKRKTLGVVVAVGPGTWKFGVFVPNIAQVGQEICFTTDGVIRPADMPELDEDLFFVPESCFIFRLKP